MTPHEKYPALMAYIEDRSPNDDHSGRWCDQLRIDEKQAVEGGLADVAQQMIQAQADYKEQQEAKGQSGFPYNSSMGIFLGLTIKSTNHEPPCGFYMASQVMHSYRLGVALRDVREILASGLHVLKTVAARDRETGRPVRFHTFQPHQIEIAGNSVVCRKGRLRVTLDSNWSIETTLEQVAQALRSGRHYGFRQEDDDVAKPAAEASVTPAPQLEPLFTH